MTETVTRPADIAPEPETDAFRPAEPDPSIARYARRLIGVREDVLDWAPEERPRYTRLGVIVLNTGLLAAISMFAALARVVGSPWPVIPIALLWGFVIIAIDSWMVSSTHGALGAGRLLMFLPRLALAVLIGVVIAEPLVLWIFHPAIHANVTQFRADSTDKYASKWKDCNPATGSTAGRPDCADYHLPIKSPQEIRDKLVNVQVQRAKLAQDVEGLAGQLQQKQQLAEDECAGVKRDGTSGSAGKGWRCDNAWKVANDFAGEVRLPDKRQQLSEMDGQVTALTGDLATAEASFGAEIAKAVADKRADRERSYGHIDLIEEVRGMDRLSRESIFVFIAQWLVRALLVVVDSLPVLAKMLGGKTTYDLLVSRQLQAGHHRHERKYRVIEHGEEATAAVHIKQIDHDRDTGIQHFDELNRTAQARHDEDLDDEIDRLAARYADEED